MRKLLYHTTSDQFNVALFIDDVAMHDDYEEDGEKEEF